MLLDRQLQYKILNITAECYPRNIHHELDELFKGVSDQKIAANLCYLSEHKLIKDKPIMYSVDGFLSLNTVCITHKGLDFLADDGGLGAILDVVTVKFEVGTLKAILESRIAQSDLTPADKQSMIDELRELPAESIKHLTMKLLDEGLENLPNAIVLIGTYLGLS